MIVKDSLTVVMFHAVVLRFKVLTLLSDSERFAYCCDTFRAVVLRFSDTQLNDCERFSYC